MRSMHSWRSTAGASAGTRGDFREATVMKIPAAQRLESDFTPKGFHSAAQGRESAPWEQAVTRGFYPEGVAQGPAAAGPIVQPLRGRNLWATRCPRVRFRDPGLRSETPSGYSLPTAR